MASTKRFAIPVLVVLGAVVAMGLYLGLSRTDNSSAASHPNILLVTFDTTLDDPQVTYEVVNIDGEKPHRITVKRSELE